MRIPVQAAPVMRGRHGTRAAAAAAIAPSSCWPSCMISKLESSLGISNLEQCGFTNVSSIVSCIIGVAKGLGIAIDPITLAGDAAWDAGVCSWDCL